VQVQRSFICSLKGKVKDQIDDKVNKISSSRAAGMISAAIGSI